MNRPTGSYAPEFIDEAIRICKGHGLDHWASFKVSEAILNSSFLLQPSVFGSLPLEILEFIFSYLDPLSKLCFTLTCKKLLRASRSNCIDLVIPSAWKHRQPPYSAECRATHSLIQLMGPIGEDGKPAESLAVCAYCFYPLPTSASHWVSNRAYLQGRWGAEFAEEYLSAWENYSAIQCPDCLVALDYCRADDWGEDDMRRLNYHQWVQVKMLSSRIEYSIPTRSVLNPFY
ncbi:hypothetical protein GGS20DRAFT_528198 [Poronia punctata]|nr:hypothetical protein GGS20DRAFT_528198 [Poronia punctata]